MVAVSWIGLIGMISDVENAGARMCPPRRLNHTCCGWSSSMPSEQLRQLCDVGRDAPRFITRGSLTGVLNVGRARSSQNTKASACPLWSRTMNQGVVSSGDGRRALPAPQTDCNRCEAEP